MTTRPTPPAWLRIKNWDRYQHYKDRSPPWIKLHMDLLTDYRFASLPDATKGHLLCVWLLGSRDAGRVPNDPRWVRERIGARSRVDLDLLVRVGFLEHDHTANASTTLAPKRKRRASPRALARDRGETETEAETETDLPTTGGRTRSRTGNTSPAPGTPNPVSRAVDLWRSKAGEPPVARLGKALKPVRAAIGDEATLEALGRWLDAGNGKYGPEVFARTYREHLNTTIELYDPVTGDMTPEAARVLGVRP